MAIIPQPPNDVQQCRIYQSLLAKSTASDGAAERVQQFVKAATPLVDLVIAGPFKEYTLHNRDHAKKLIHLAGYVIPPETLGNLSVLEHLVFIYSAYLHDMGMCLTSTERNRIVTSEEFMDTLRGWPEIWDAIEHARERLSAAGDPERLLIEARIYQLQEAGLCAYLRPRHATPERYGALIGLLKRESGRADLFEFGGVSFEAALTDICVSHNLDVGALAEVHGPYDERFPRNLPIGGERLNTQFCAAVLRLADILDFDRERTPRILFESLGIPSRSLPGAEVTIREWQKHMAIHTMEIEEEEIIVSAESRHPVIEKTIKDFCQIIEREIRDTLAVLRRNPPNTVSQYYLELPISVRPSIRSIGYTFKDMALRLNEAAVMSLLMGDRLYSQPAVAIRELIQNSIDACAVRQQIEGAGNYEAKILITLSADDANRRWIEVGDNGIGMDEHVLTEYFLKLGNSYYDSPEFQRIIRSAPGPGLPFTSISRFGIGIVSVFMIADILEVSTRSARSPRNDGVARCVRVERMGRLAFVTESPSGEAGTRIRIRVRPEFESEHERRKICGYLQEIIVRPKFDVRVELLEAPFVLTKSNNISLKASGAQILSAMGIEPVLLDLARWSDRLSGVVVLLLARDGADELSHIQGGTYLRFGGTGVEPKRVLDGYGGNRITVNGFKMNLKKMGKLFGGGGENRLAVAFDVDVRGDAEVVYDVSRDRIIGEGKVAVVKAFREAVLKGLQETGVIARLHPHTKNLLEGLFRRRYEHQGRVYSYQPIIDQDLLDAVARELPKEKWPVGVHRTIAERLQLSGSEVYRAISTLLDMGAIEKPV